jgi:dipeptidyl-peptidase-4
MRTRTRSGISDTDTRTGYGQKRAFVARILRPMTSARIAAWTLAAVALAGGAGGAKAGDAPGAPPPAAADSGRLTIERLFDPDRNGGPYTGPLLDGVQWRPKHDEWTEWRGKKEERALWLVEAESGKERRLVGVSDFDPWKPPQDAPVVEARGIGRAGPPSYVWAPTGDAVYLTIRGDVFRFDVATEKRIRCTQTKSPISDLRIAPDGTKFSFCRDDDLWAVRIEDGKAREVRLTTGGSETIRNGSLDWVYPEELGCETAAWWSPDSTRVAFLQLDETNVSKFPISDYLPRLGKVEWQFYPKAGDPNPVPRVGVVGLDGKSPVWMDVKDTDAYVPWVAWLPGGTHLMLTTLARSQRHMSLLVFGHAGELMEGFPLGAADGSWCEVPPAPRALDRRHTCLWSTRPDRGRLSLFSFSGERDFVSSLTRITPESVDAGDLLAFDQASEAVYFEGRSDDLLRGIVWKTTLAGEPPVRVTSDRTSHRASFSETGRWFLDTETNAAVPPRVTLRRADGTAVRVVADAMTPQYAAMKIEPPEFGRVPAKGDLPDLMYSLRKPKGFDPSKKYPVVVHTYGGPGARMVKDEFGGLFDALMAQEGFVVFALDNRGSGGRGKSFETPVYKRLGKVELEDQVRGVEWLKQQPWVDGERIGIWGWSYGGYMTCYAMTKAPGVFKAGVAVAPVTDWRLYDTIYTERYMGLPKENEEGYKDSSPVHFAKDLQGALLLLHGLGDDNVHVQNTVVFAEALLKAGKRFDLMLYPRRGHGIEGPEARVDVYRRILDHFRRNL